jgi:4'-phosphopantetheinyl transferase
VGWLTEGERRVLGGLRLEKRRTDWLLGRWAGKLALRSLLGRADDVGEILASEGGRPEVHPPPGTGPREGVSLSISHSAGVGFAAARVGPIPVGCDVEGIEPRSSAFVADYFTAHEAAAVEGAPPTHRALLATLIWSAKESALKVLGEGLRLDTRTVEVDTGGLKVDGDAWSPLVVTAPKDRIFRGRWRVRHGLVWTVLSAPA